MRIQLTNLGFIAYHVIVVASLSAYEWLGFGLHSALMPKEMEELMHLLGKVESVTLGVNSKFQMLGFGKMIPLGLSL